MCLLFSDLLHRLVESQAQVAPKFINNYTQRISRAPTNTASEVTKVRTHVQGGKQTGVIVGSAYFLSHCKRSNTASKLFNCYTNKQIAFKASEQQTLKYSNMFMWGNKLGLGKTMVSQGKLLHFSLGRNTGRKMVPRESNMIKIHEVRSHDWSQNRPTVASVRFPIMFF